MRQIARDSDVPAGTLLEYGLPGMCAYSGWPQPDSLLRAGYVTIINQS